MAPMMMGLVSPHGEQSGDEQGKGGSQSAADQAAMKAENSCVRSLPHRNCTRPQQKAETAKSKGPPPKRTQKKPALRAMQRVETRGETDLAGGFLSRSRASWGVSLPVHQQAGDGVGLVDPGEIGRPLLDAPHSGEVLLSPGQIDEEPRGKGDHMDLVEGVMGRRCARQSPRPGRFRPRFRAGRRRRRWRLGR